MNKGFTLLELLIALVLFVVGMVAIGALFSQGIIGGTDAENTLIAMNLAQQKMEEIKNLTFIDIDDEEKADVNGFSGFQREVTVEDEETDLKEVTVKVYWTYKGEEVEVPLVTYVCAN